MTIGSQRLSRTSRGDVSPSCPDSPTLAVRSSCRWLNGQVGSLAACCSVLRNTGTDTGHRPPLHPHAC